MGKKIYSWEARLCQAQFPHNHATNISLGFSAFQVLCSILPRRLLDLTSQILEFEKSLKTIHKETCDQLKLSNQAYKIRDNTKRREVIFKLGELVWLC